MPKTLYEHIADIIAMRSDVQPDPRIPPLSGALYPREKTDYEEFYGGKRRRQEEAEKKAAEKTGQFTLPKSDRKKTED